MCAPKLIFYESACDNHTKMTLKKIKENLNIIVYFQAQKC